jgi:hypothetical protein
MYHPQILRICDVLCPLLIWDIDTGTIGLFSNILRFKDILSIFRLKNPDLVILATFPFLCGGAHIAQSCGVKFLVLHTVPFLICRLSPTESVQVNLQLIDGYSFLICNFRFLGVQRRRLLLQLREWDSRLHLDSLIGWLGLQVNDVILSTINIPHATR